jgi:hypothetical protein
MQTTTPTKSLTIGARIHHRGDMSNAPKSGTVSYVDADSFKVDYDDGSKTPCPLPSCLVGMRFRLL